MASLMSSSASSSLSSNFQRGLEATLQAPKTLTELPIRNLVEEKSLTSEYPTITTTQTEMKPSFRSTTTSRSDDGSSDPNLIAQLYAIMEAAADRNEMHANIGEQRDNWNRLLLTSINALTLTAATMAGLAAATGAGQPLLALKLSSTLLYAAATWMLLVVNKIQPSQLAEEQRNAARLFKQLQWQIQTVLALRTPTSDDVKDAMAKVLALDKAYPLPLLGTMLDKFPSSVEPALWWPQLGRRAQRQAQVDGKVTRNGWTKKLEEQMKEIVGVLKRNDTAQFVRLSKFVLKINRVLAISGPLLTGIAALGSAFMGSSSHGSWAVFVAVTAGVLASVVNIIEHGGQVGMVFEMYRSSAGFFRCVEESINSNLKEEEVERRENGELLEMKVALQLGRSLSELRRLGSSSSTIKEESKEEFASKLF